MTLLAPYVTMQNVATALGNGTAMTVTGLQMVAFQFVETGDNIVTFEGTVDGTNWHGLLAINVALGQVKTTASISGIYCASVVGLKEVRARVSSYMSGSATVTARALAAGAPFPMQPLGPSVSMGDNKTANLGPHIYDSNGNAQSGWLNFPFSFNDTGWDRVRNNVDGEILASAARTATVDGADQTNYNGRGVWVCLDVTAVTDTPSIVLKIQAKCPSSSKYETLLEGAAVTATGTHSYVVYPAGDMTAGEDVVEAQPFPLPRTWRVRVEHEDTDSITYSVGASVIL